MSDLFAALSSAAGALRAFQNALDITGNNVANSQTAGYVKQVPQFDALTFDPSAGLNGGVQSAPTTDSRNQYAEVAVQHQTSLLGSSSQLATSLDPIEQVFTVTGTGGISNALDSLFQSFSAWSASPNDASAKSTVLNAAAQVASAFQQSAAQLDTIRSSVNGDLQTTVASINQISARIQQYNLAKQASSTPDAGRDAQLYSSLEQLSQLVDIQTTTNSDGTLNVLMGGQVPLVTGAQQHQLSVQFPSPSNGSNPGAPPNAAIVDDSGADVTQKIANGQLGALVSVRNQILPRLIGGPSDIGDLNSLATEIASNVNGLLTGAGGQPLFQQDPNSAVDAAATLSVNSVLQPQDLVAADPGPPAVSNGIALKLSNLGSAQNANLSNMTFGQFYGSSASWIGNQLNQAQTASDAQTQTVAQAQALRQQLSGVSLDEEAMRLMQLQRSYQAASRMVTVIDGLTQNVIDMVQ
jgi:flagellar hook-associated protein 1 FlgK